MLIFTIFAMFGDDFKYIISDSKVSFEVLDLIFNILTLVSIFLFSLEIILHCIADRREDEPETLKTTYI
jgi:hypothetical protein